MLLDLREQSVDLSKALIIEWANRRTGIGFDQLIVLALKGLSLQYRFFNADGGEAEQCGNGQRAIAHYLHHQGTTVKDLKLSGLGGEVTLNYNSDDEISVTFEQSVQVTEHEVAGVAGLYVEMGNPHWVYHEPELRAKDLIPFSHLVNNEFHHGANVEAIKKINDQHIQVRVIERGVGETQACGSGACAAAIASAKLFKTTSPLMVSMLGGDLHVSYDDAGEKLTLTGPATAVYNGEISIPNK